MSHHPLSNFEIQKYYQNETKFNGVHSKNNLPKIKHGANEINPDEFKSIGTHGYVCMRIIMALSIICSKCKNEDEQIFKEEESIEIL